MSKINLPIAELKPALAGLGKIIAKRTTLPVLSCIRLERTKDGWITLTGTDLDTFVTMRLEEPSNGEPASILVPFEDLAKVVKGCSTGETITIENAGNDVVIRYPVGQQSAQIKVESCSVEEFPSIPRIKGDPVPLNDGVRTALLEAFECASTDETRYILQGACIDVSDRKCHQIVATDGRHLYGSNSFTLPLKESVVIPTNKFLIWKEFNNDGEWQLRAEPGKTKDDHGYLQISTRRWRFIHKQVEGNYPNWRQVIPKSDQFKTTIEFEPPACKDLMQVISRMPDHDKTNHTIGITVVGRKVWFTSKSDDKPLEIEIHEAAASGKNTVLFLNRNYLIKALAFELCQLQVVDEKTAMRFNDNAGRQMIVMPVRDYASPPAPVHSPAPNQTSPEPDGDSASTPAHSEHSTERSTTMPRPSTNGHSNGTNGHKTDPEQPVSIDTALEQIEQVKGSYREAIRGLNTLTDTLKQVQRGQKTTEKEVQSVRSTLEKLQTLKI